MGPGGEAPGTVNGGREREGRCRGWNPRGRDGTRRRDEERGEVGTDGRSFLNDLCSNPPE